MCDGAHQIRVSFGTSNQKDFSAYFFVRKEKTMNLHITSEDFEKLSAFTEHHNVRHPESIMTVDDMGTLLLHYIIELVSIMANVDTDRNHSTSAP